MTSQRKSQYKVFHYPWGIANDSIYDKNFLIIKQENDIMKVYDEKKSQE